MSCDSLCIVSTSLEVRKLRNRSPTFHPLNSKGAPLNRAHFENQTEKVASYSPSLLQTCGTVFIQSPEQCLQQESACSLLAKAEIMQQLVD